MKNWLFLLRYEEWIYKVVYLNVGVLYLNAPTIRMDRSQLGLIVHTDMKILDEMKQCLSSINSQFCYGLIYYG